MRPHLTLLYDVVGQELDLGSMGGCSVGFVIETIAAGAWGDAWKYRIDRLAWPDGKVRYCVSVWPKPDQPTHDHTLTTVGCSLFFTEIQARRAIPDLIQKA